MKKLIDLNSDSFEHEVINHNGVVVVDFWAEWCGPCKMLTPILEEISTNSQHKICKVDVDSNNELASKFQIRSIPSLLVFKNGEKVDHIVGFKAKDELLQLLSNY